MDTTTADKALPRPFKVIVGVFGGLILLIAAIDIAQAVQLDRTHPVSPASLIRLHASVPARVPNPDAFNEQWD